MYRSISIFVLFALLASAIGGPNREEFRAAKEKCITETGIDPELLKGPPSMDEPVGDNVKCFYACMMKQHGGLNEDGTFNLAVAISRVPDDVPEREKIVAALTECADKKGANDCDTAYEIFKCIREKKLPHMGPRHHQKRD